VELCQKLVELEAVKKHVSKKITVVEWIFGSNTIY
jgi:hypothetical protein